MGCEIPLVEASTYFRLTEKRSATDFFSAAGLAAPREMHAETICEPPVVAKPFRNISEMGRSLYPHLLDTRARIETFATHDPKDYFFQEYVHGDSLYLLFHLSRTGGHDFVWSQRNLLQQPDGKSMLLAEPSGFHRSDAAGKIMRALRDAGFHGLGMVEVIRTPEREVFIEMNPRIWGPVQFCLDQQQPLLQPSSAKPCTTIRCAIRTAGRDYDEEDISGSAACWKPFVPAGRRHGTPPSARCFR